MLAAAPPIAFLARMLHWHRLICNLLYELAFVCKVILKHVASSRNSQEPCGPMSGTADWASSSGLDGNSGTRPDGPSTTHEIG